MIESAVKKSKQLRIKILKAIKNAGKGHIGGAYSCIDMLSVLYYCGFLCTKTDDLKDPSRNRFLLSKGHAAIAQYVILEDLGLITNEDLQQLNNGGILGEHPDHKIPGVEFDSGSLGHGLGVASGFALAAKLNSYKYKTYVVLGDGECHEGSVWEAAMLASHLKLNNLVAFIDRNRLCIHGDTEKINGLNPFSDKWKAFGWNVIEIDGHDHQQIFNAILKSQNSSAPTAIIANTIKGKGVSFMENNPKWHHGGVDIETFKKCLDELEAI